jgi:hypothetical protein
MVIKLVHCGKELCGKVIFNFDQLANVVLVQFDALPKGISSDVIIYKETGVDNWLGTENMEKLCPDLYQQLMYKLKKVLKEADIHVKKPEQPMILFIKRLTRN